MIKSPEQLRAARYFLNLTQEELAEMSGVSRPTIADFERRKEGRITSPESLAALEKALVKAGIIFLADGEAGGTEGLGVRVVKRRKR